MEQSPSYTDMVIIGYDNENCINSIRINSTAVNSIVQKSTLESQNRITELGSHGIDVPVGSLSGIMLLSLIHILRQKRDKNGDHIITI